MSRDVSLVIEELVLDGVEPDDALAHAALMGALAPHLAEHGLEEAASRLASSVSAAMTEESSDVRGAGRVA
jgi:hypothetical protein